MKKSSHTPGPWSFGSDINSAEQSVHTDFKQIAMVNSSIGNARLIAAAPEMLEALEEFIRCGPHAGQNRDLLKVVESVIAKAQGKQEGQEVL